ncbi:MAG: isocitrate/isopropylmalate dehydrogenase family protein [Granulosicoccus sp.]|nr:isocitrate/isopropylmalate dehydrogenase family protein [Granulosicoccus sp.]
MSTDRIFTIAVFEGDGIGPEITAPCCELLQQACHRVSSGSETVSLLLQPLSAGAATYQATGDALPRASIQAARQADAILLSAMGDPAVRYPDGTEITPQIDLRFELELYAGLRPVRSIPGVPGPLSDSRAASIDFVLVRESIEGLFARQAPARLIGDEQAEETLVITRAISEKLFDATFALARRRLGIRLADGMPGAVRVTCIDKANVFPAFAFFRKLFNEADLRNNPKDDEGCRAMVSDHAYVDIMAHNLVTRPWEYDVMVTENMFGDILSDLGAALIGGMGYAPSADIGDEHAVFQPCHGSAPDIAGQGVANPTAMFLSAAMMLEWLAERNDCEALGKAGRLIVRAVDEAFAKGRLRTVELGGDSTLDDVAKAVEQQVATLAV